MSSKRTIKVALVCVTCLISFTAAAWGNCMSLVGRAEWPAIARAISSTQVCEQLPFGPNHTQSFSVQSANLCRTADGNAILRATAIVTCVSGDEALFDTPPIEAEVVATLAINEKACRVTDAQLEVGGALASLLPAVTDASELARRWTQSELSRLCHMR
jgi:hypothetical protein